MAIPVTEAERREYVGLPQGGSNVVLDLIWAAVETEIERHAPDAPVAVQKLAALSALSYAWSNRGGDRNEAGDIVPANALRKSGALTLLRPYVEHRAGLIEDTEDD